MQANAPLTRRARREHDLVRLGVESSEQFRDQSRLDGAGFTQRNDITNDGVDPGYFVDAEKNARMRPDLELVDGRFRQQVAIYYDPLLHVRPDFFLDDSL